jgi:RES domain-containing protein
VKLWRIAAETRSYPADALSGAGAAGHPGRWNDHGEPILYAAATVSLAVLETAAHVDAAGLPLNRYLIEIDVPDATWALREEVDVAALAPAWSAIPAGKASVSTGSDWLHSLRSPILLVPSVIVPEEHAVLVNPAHPACTHISARVVRLFEYQRLFRWPRRR